MQGRVRISPLVMDCLPMTPDHAYNLTQRDGKPTVWIDNHLLLQFDLQSNSASNTSIHSFLHH